ncbi:hypothetical protein AVEN_172778-1 [Araneus ventricosus]|uniref:Uncharacterized protein n=1 Tax=Araneus ventricosus TaxID=182803 RepID=A0A4Y2BJS5_ARAVE|nr:hypothetical protein AVEN_172778-1 [Araneus ventricosus]
MLSSFLEEEMTLPFNRLLMLFHVLYSARLQSITGKKNLPPEEVVAFFQKYSLPWILVDKAFTRDDSISIIIKKEEYQAGSPIKKVWQMHLVMRKQILASGQNTF